MLIDQTLEEVEQVILLDEACSRVGVAPKSSVHHADTPLHLAFSCHVTDPAGRVLVTRRALSKATWPGVWSNACCGHPGPGEQVGDAVTRRARDELGIAVEAVTLVLPTFRYRAVDDSGVVENEVCPVYTARTRDQPDPDPTEVMAHRWVRPGDLAASIALTPWAFSPWLVSQAAELPLLAATRRTGAPGPTDGEAR
ncbi:isopentenyl-diphosphate Delta-isomerase [Propionibacteriaceae bacterium Y2011]